MDKLTKEDHEILILPTGRLMRKQEIHDHAAEIS